MCRDPPRRDLYPAWLRSGRRPNVLPRRCWLVILVIALSIPILLRGMLLCSIFGASPQRLVIPGWRGCFWVLESSTWDSFWTQLVCITITTWAVTKSRILSLGSALGARTCLFMCVPVGGCVSPFLSEMGFECPLFSTVFEWTWDVLESLCADLILASARSLIAQSLEV